MELKKNPFYTLNVGCDADRNTIHEAADELAFFDEDGSVEEARNALLNPARRLTAEMDWFPGLSKAGIDELRQGLENDAPLLVSSEADALSRLNVSAYNLRFARMTDAALADTIRRLDATAAEAGAGTVLPLILAARSKARMPEVSEDDIARELNRKRGEIRQIVAEKLSTMPRQDYVRLMTTLAETLVGQSERGGVIDDAVDQYEIRMHDELRKRADEIRTRIEAVKACGTVSSNEIDGLIEEVKAWDELAAMASGDNAVTNLSGLDDGSDIEGYQELYTGDVMMVPRGPWCLQEGIDSFGLELGKDFDYVAMPFYGPEKKFASETGWSMAVAAGLDEAQEAAAFDFLNYFFSDEVIMQHNLACGQIPAKEAVAQDPEYLKKYPIAEPLVGILDGAQFIGFFNTDVFKECINETFSAYCKGEAGSTDEALAALEKTLNKKLYK